MKQETGAIARIDEGIWAADGFAKLFPGAHLPVRATVCRLSDGTLMVHSPIAFSLDQVTEIRRLGDVSVLFAPNLYHHLFLNSAQQHFPEARIVAPQGLEKKNATIKVDDVVNDELPSLLRDEFELQPIEGSPAFRELVLFHRRSKSLLVGDYFFNIQQTKGWATPLVLKMTGSYQKATQSKLWRRMTKDRDAMQRSAQGVLAFDTQRVIMCHGEVVEDGVGFMRESLAWLNVSA